MKTLSADMGGSRVKLATVEDGTVVESEMSTVSSEGFTGAPGKPHLPRTVRQGDLRGAHARVHLRRARGGDRSVADAFAQKCVGSTGLVWVLLVCLEYQAVLSFCPHRNVMKAG